MNNSNSNSFTPLWPILGLGLVYICGAIGLCIPAYTDWFASFIALNILLTLFTLLAYHKDRSIVFYVGAVFVVLAGFWIEVIGVQTERIFGQYSYGTLLGPKLMDVPLILGFNWLLLIYISAAIMQRSAASALVQIFGGALIMVGLDTLLEPFAIIHKLWIWPGGVVEPQNFLGWFVVSSAILACLYPLRIRYSNSIVYPIFILQIIFLLIQNIWFLYINPQ